SIWISVKGQRELDEAKMRFAAAEGDHVTFLNVYKGFLQSNRSSKWCHQNSINYHAMVSFQWLERTAVDLALIVTFNIYNIHAVIA
ncbi:hypothetical protein Tco_0167057, partial [Tanacetum coccineum]